MSEIDYVKPRQFFATNGENFLQVDYEDGQPTHVLTEVFSLDLRVTHKPRGGLNEDVSTREDEMEG